jgi:hypothetical protein
MTFPCDCRAAPVPDPVLRCCCLTGRERKRKRRAAGSRSQLSTGCASGHTQLAVSVQL